MSTVILDEHRLTVRFEQTERLFVRRDHFTVDRAAILGAAVTDKPLRVPHGARGGLSAAGLAKIGVWGLLGGVRQLVSVRRGRPALRLLLDPDRADGFSELVVSVPDADRLAEALAPTGVSRR